jgi:hypothetical protein
VPSGKKSAPSRPRLHQCCFLAPRLAGGCSGAFGWRLRPGDSAAIVYKATWPEESIFR